SLPAVTVNPGETVKTGKTTVTNDNPGVTMTHDTPGTDTNGKPTTDQTGETINPDGTSSFWKVPEPVSTTKDGYYVTTTTKDPDGGTTDTKVDGSGAVTQIDKTWGDGDKTKVTIDKTGNAVFTETPNGQPSLPSQTVTPGNTATAGKTTLTNNEPNGIQLTHKPGDAPSVTETVTPDGSITFGMMPEPVSVEKSGNTNGNPGKPGDNGNNPTGNTDNEGGNTNTSTGNGTGSTGTDTTTGSNEGTAVKTPNGESSNGGSTTGDNTGNANVSTNVAGDQSVGNNQASVTGTNGNVSSQNQKTVAQGKLPQTNDQKNSVGATIGLGLLGLLAALGLKRKKRDDE
ncbi:LPXTG cell wall anchor domain-containing protein, partial [Lactobacillus sp. LC28-10]